MTPGIPSTKCTRGPKYISVGSRQLRYFSTLTHSPLTLELARELRYESSSSLFLLHCVSLCVVCESEGCPSIYTRGGVTGATRSAMSTILMIELVSH